MIRIRLFGGMRGKEVDLRDNYIGQRKNDT